MLITILCSTIQPTELLSSWESLAKWSENAAEAKRLQNEMHELRVVIKGYGTHSVLLESKEAIKETIQNFQVSKVEEYQERNVKYQAHTP